MKMEHSIYKNIFFVMKFFRYLVIYFVLGVGSTIANAVEYTVAQHGDDSNPGTIDSPFSSISRCAEIAVGGDTCWVRSGTYRETVVPANSGSENAPISFKTYPGDTVLISGTDVVTNFSAIGSNRYRANIDWDLGVGRNQVFSDGKMLWEARFPNANSDVMSSMSGRVINPQGQGAYWSIDAPGMPAGIGGARINILPGVEWVAETGTVTNSSANTLSFEVHNGQLNDLYYSLQEGNPYTVWDHPALLDDANEFFHGGNTLEVKVDPASHVIEAKRRDYAFILDGLSYINIEGFHVFAATITTGNPYPSVESLLSYPNQATSQNIVISDVHFRYVSHFTDILPGNETNLLVNSNFESSFEPQNTCSQVNGNIGGGWEDNTCWEGTSNITYSKEASNPHSGSFSQKVNTQGNLVQFVQNINLEADKPYTAAVWLRSQSPMNVTLMLRQADAPYSIYEEKVVSLTAEWQRFSVSMDPLSAPENNIYFMIRTDQHGIFWVDDADVYVDAGIYLAWNKGITDSGVMLYGSNHKFTNSSIVYSAGNGITLGGSNHEVDGVVVHDVDYAVTDGAALSGGFYSYNSAGHTVQGNSFYRSGRSILTHRGVQNLTVTNNDLYDAGLVAKDLGITYTYQTDGNGTIIANNWVHGNTREGDFIGIYLDNDSSGMTIHHNIVWDVTHAFQLNMPQFANTPMNNVIANNTLIGNETSIRSWGETLTYYDQDFSTVLLMNNILVGLRSSYTSSGNITPIVFNEVSNYETDDVSELQFVDLLENDFRLLNNSPAIDGGVVISGITDDYSGSAPDIGAYEGLQQIQVGATITEACVYGDDCSSNQNNILMNPGLESPYQSQTNCTNISGNIAEGWEDNTCWNSAAIVSYSEDNNNPHSGLSSQRIQTQGSLVQFVQYLTLPANQSFSASVWMRTDSPMDVSFMLRKPDSPYTVYAQQTFELTSQWAKYSISGLFDDVSSDAFLMIVSEQAGLFWVDDASLSLNNSSPANIYEDAEDSTTTGWVVYDSDPAGAAVTNVFDSEKASRVIAVQGSGTQNGYRLGNHAGKMGAWNNTSQKIISWDLNFPENFSVYISVDTELGQRFLVYRPRNSNLGIRGSGGNYIHMGLGSAVRDGQWHTITRDLETDLQVFEAGNQILSVNGFWVRGSGRLDNITLSTSQPDSVFEDAEDGNASGWVVYDQTPAGALISNENDAAKGSRVITVQGSGTQNGYRLGNHASKAGAWNNTSQTVISWDMKFSENFKLFVTVDTPLGQRYLVYRPVNTDSGIGGTNGNYIHHGLGVDAKNGQWQSFSRDLQADLQEFEAGNQILSVNGVLIRGSGRVDEITLSSNNGLFGAWYRPSPLTTWQWQLQGSINTSYDVQMYDIDLFDTSETLIQQLQDDGKKVICYFSGGSYEEWRSDASQFDLDDLGNPLDGWVGERWLDIRSANVRTIMKNRLDIAVQKGCDGVEPDNMDAYTNNPGFNFNADDQVNYNRFIANEAHARNLAVGLKNDLNQVEDLVDYFDFAVNEQCFQYNECGLLAPFINQGKAVFNAEYLQQYVNDPIARNALCEDSLSQNFSTLVLPLDLDDSFRHSCF